MKVLCYDNKECDNLFVFDVVAAYYDEDVNGLVLESSCSDCDAFCFPDMHPDICNKIISYLYDKGCYNFTKFGCIQLYSDIVDVPDDELPFS